MLSWKWEKLHFSVFSNRFQYWKDRRDEQLTTCRTDLAEVCQAFCGTMEIAVTNRNF